MEWKLLKEKCSGIQTFFIIQHKTLRAEIIVFFLIKKFKTKNLKILKKKNQLKNWKTNKITKNLGEGETYNTKMKFLLLVTTMMCTGIEEKPKEPSIHVFSMW